EAHMRLGPLSRFSLALKHQPGMLAHSLSRALRLSCLGLLLAAGSSVMVAQASPDVEQGIKPYGSYHGGAIDTVSLSNGNLFLHAGLFTYSQRGGELAYPISLQYNNKNFGVYQPACPPGTKLGTTQCPFRMTIVFGPNSLVNNNVSHGNSVKAGFEGLP